MGTEQRQQSDSGEQQQSASGQLTEKPEVTDEHKEMAKKMAESYDEQRPTTKMPGTGGGVAGTAINEWLDDEGNPKFSEESKNDDA